MLSPEIQAEILVLYYRDQRPIRSIARDLSVNRNSVRAVIQRRSVSLVPTQPQRSSILDPYKELIDELLKRDAQLTSTSVLNHLRSQGYSGGLSIIKEYLHQRKAQAVKAKQAFLRLEFEPAEAAQVDWGEFGDVFGDGVKIHCFFMAYMGHHSIRPHACNVARGNEKGRVEDAVKYIRNNFWSGRVFTDFEDLTKQGIIWRNQVANQREHRTTKKIVRLLFETQEKPYLFKCANSFSTDEVVSKVVPSDFHVIYETNRYSVPWTLAGLPVTLRSSDQQIKIFYNERLVAFHPRSYQKYKVFTTEVHRQGLIDRKPGASRVDWQLSAVKALGPSMTEYLNLLKNGARSLRSELTKMLALSTVYGERAVYEAVEELLCSSVVGTSALELELKRRFNPAQVELKPEPIQFSVEKLNRVVPVTDLRRYDALLFESYNSESAKREEKEGHEDDGS